jgi:hypothetical protein
VVPPSGAPDEPLLPDDNQMMPPYFDAAD